MPDFPRPVRLGRCVSYRENDLQDYIDRHIDAVRAYAERDEANGKDTGTRCSAKADCVG